MEKPRILLDESTFGISQILNTSNIKKVICVYRYASLFFTSFFYLIGEPKSPIIFKIGVILSLLIAANIVTNLYMKYNNVPSSLIMIIFTETIGITFLLIPTGGITSPFIWYALNPVLVAASFLPAFICWINLLFYITCESIITYAIFNNRNNTIFDLLYKNCNLILIFILITMVVQLMAELAKELNIRSLELEQKNYELIAVNNKLSQTNNKVQESMDNIMSLYQIVEALTSQDGKENVVKIFTNYTMKLTKSDFCFFWTKDYMDIGSVTPLNNKKNLISQYSDSIKTIWETMKYEDASFHMNILGQSYILTVVSSNSKYYGLIGIKCKYIDDLKDELKRQLIFLSGLSGVILERLNLEEVANYLTIVEEQNRIAGEIHDSVSQQLFSMVCSIHYVISKWDALKDIEIIEQLNLIKETATISTHQLRNAIYQLSSRKKGEQTFINQIKLYVDGISKLNNINIEFKAQGDENEINLSVKKTLYRIICESCGNSIRHGKCNILKIDLLIKNDILILNIIDNGIGFITDDINGRTKLGLGIYNMKKLTKNFNGKFEIISNQGQGTKINIIIPNKNIYENTRSEIAL